MDKIILDGMGGDNAPAAIVEGAVRALKDDKRLYLIIAGREAEIKAELAKYKYDASRVEILDCPDVIGMNDVPTEAIKNKQASLTAAYWHLKKNEDVCGLVSAGSTGAIIAGGQLILGRIRNKARRALPRHTQRKRSNSTVRLRRKRRVQALYALPVRPSRFGVRSGGLQ